MKKFLVGMVAAVALIFTFAQAVHAWTSVFDVNGKEYEFTKSITGTEVHQSTYGLRKLTYPELVVLMTLSKASGSSWVTIGSKGCHFAPGIGIVNQGISLDKTTSGTVSFKGNWKQTTAGTMNASIDITNYISW